MYPNSRYFGPEVPKWGVTLRPTCIPKPYEIAGSEPLTIGSNPSNPLNGRFLDAQVSFTIWVQGAWVLSFRELGFGLLSPGAFGLDFQVNLDLN